VETIQAQLPEPDAWFFIDIPAEESVRRRPDRCDYYEKRPGFMERVRRAYRDLFEKKNIENRPWFVIDGMGTIDEVHDRIWKMMQFASALRLQKNQ
jgi:thymidylate kinase